MIHGIIFDVGNTLMYFDGEWNDVMARGADAMVDYLAGRGYAVPDGLGRAFLDARAAGSARALETNREYTADQALTDTLARQGVCYVPDAVIPRAIEKFFEPEAPHWIAYPDAVLTLQDLQRRGLKLALYSNATYHPFIEQISQQGGIAPFLDPLLSSAATGIRKPDPRAFNSILAVWNLSPREIMMVGDSPSFDILGAHRAGMWGVLIDPGGMDPPKAHGVFDDAHRMQPDAVIRQLAELPSVLDAITTKEIGQ